MDENYLTYGNDVGVRALNDDENSNDDLNFDFVEEETDEMDYDYAKSLVGASWINVLSKSTPREPFGRSLVDCIYKIQNQQIVQNSSKGRSVLAESFEVMIASIVTHSYLPDAICDDIPVMAIRHAHFNVNEETSQAFLSALLSTLEQFLQDDWDSDLEEAWRIVWFRVNHNFVEMTKRFRSYIKIVEGDWNSAVEQLGVDALAAKLQANLIVKMAENMKSPSSNIVAHAQNKHGLAIDICELLRVIVNLLTTPSKLQSLTNSLEIDLDEVFKNYKAVPDLRKIGLVALQTITEIVGQNWNTARAEAWNWVWELACRERNRRWTPEHCDFVLEGWRMIERNVKSNYKDKRSGTAANKSTNNVSQRMNSPDEQIQQFDHHHHQSKHLQPLNPNSLSEVYRHRSTDDPLTPPPPSVIVSGPLDDNSRPLNSQSLSPDANHGVTSTTGPKHLDSQGQDGMINPNALDNASSHSQVFNNVNNLSGREIIDRPIIQHAPNAVSNGNLNSSAINVMTSLPLPQTAKRASSSQELIEGSHDDGDTLNAEMAEVLAQQSAALERGISTATEVDVQKLMNQEWVSDDVVDDTFKPCPKAIPVRISRDVPTRVGAMFYSLMLDRVPSLKRIFSLNPAAYGLIFQRLMLMLLMHAAHPVNMWDDHPKLALKHVNFGVRPDDIPLFKVCFMQALRVVGDPYWQSAYEIAWSLFLDYTTRSLSNIVQAGSQPICRAIIRRSVTDLEVALQEAPRSSRSEMGCSLDLRGDKRSPLYWSLDFGRLDMAGLLLKDILALRADRVETYYGARHLWAYHPDLVAKLCDKAPSLLHEFLDGHMWASDQVREGQRKIIFWAREIFGDPANALEGEETLVCKTPLARIKLAVKDDNPLFDHPLLVFVGERKWSLFAWGEVLKCDLLTFLQAICMTIGFVGFSTSISYSVTSAYFRLISVLIGLYHLVRQLKIIFEQIRRGELLHLIHPPEEIAWLKLPVHLRISLWNWIRLICSILMIAIYSLELHYSSKGNNRPILVRFHDPSIDSSVVYERARNWPNFLREEIDAEGTELSSLGMTTLILCWVQLCRLLHFSQWGRVTLAAVYSMFTALVLFTIFLFVAVIVFAMTLALATGEETSFSSALVPIWSVIISVPEDKSRTYTVKQNETFALLVVALASVTIGLSVLSLLVAMITASLGRQAHLSERKATYDIITLNLEIEASLSLSQRETSVQRLMRREADHFDTIAQPAPPGGVETFVGPEFRPAYVSLLGRFDRIERHDLEAGRSSEPWPRDETSTNDPHEFERNMNKALNSLVLATHRMVSALSSNAGARARRQAASKAKSTHEESGSVWTKTSRMDAMLNNGQG